jgi:hypothetical protein
MLAYYVSSTSVFHASVCIWSTLRFSRVAGLHDQLKLGPSSMNLLMAVVSIVICKYVCVNRCNHAVFHWYFVHLNARMCKLVYASTQSMQ